MYHMYEFVYGCIYACMYACIYTNTNNNTCMYACKMYVRRVSTKHGAYNQTICFG
jgi:hypothetical protein